MFLFPSIDLRDGKVVRLQQGNYDQQTTYGNDPIAQARLFERAGASWLHVVDLDGARIGRVAHVEVITAICQATKLKIEVGGGVRSEAAIDALLSVGVTRVSLGTAALQNWKWFEKLVTNSSYQNRIVLDLGANKGKLTVSGWEKQLDTTALEIAQRVTDWPLAAIVYTDIATDGTMKGPNLEATAQIAGATKVPIVSSGGVGTLDHLRQLRRLPLQGVIVGRALYEGAFTPEEAIRVVEL
ncbi:MAG: 1-(5-phosphoribosyl)-5-[(5-phosphoribosylamino)methylideneamino]imidazole-4-carboxamide isomerase [Phycisphaeraceae bacterium]|nr:1-(5-phosphoribosyl)-5-[(5-phosphoribosylamino)methylideneamino]imidazole-4-carboxamide isomerase [Phycisphaeraceae bacterium]